MCFFMNIILQTIKKEAKLRFPDMGNTGLCLGDMFSQGYRRLSRFSICS